MFGGDQPGKRKRCLDGSLVAIKGNGSSGHASDGPSCSFEPSRLSSRIEQDRICFVDDFSVVVRDARMPKFSMYILSSPISDSSTRQGNQPGVE